MSVISRCIPCTSLECMHVTSEEGDYSFSRTSHHRLLDVAAAAAASHTHHSSSSSSSGSDESVNLHDTDDGTPSMAVCGLYVVTDPDKYVEITIKYLNVNCESGGLMAVRVCLLAICFIYFEMK